MAGKDYDEFRNFVSVSQLKPTSGRDVSSLFSGASGSVTSGSARSSKVQGVQGTIGGFDDIIKRRKDASHPSASMRKLDCNLDSLSLVGASKINSKDNANKALKKTSREFTKEWTLHCQTAKDTLLFLTRVNGSGESESFEKRLLLQPDVICKEYFTTDIDSEILGDIVEALHLLTCMMKDGSPLVNPNETTLNNPDGEDGRQGLSELSSSDANVLSYTHGWLKALMTCGRFELGVSFLMADQQLKLKEICNILKESNQDNTANNDSLLRYDDLLKK